MVQNPKGGGLSSSFGGDTQQIGGVKKTTDFLDKTTWILASLILVLILFSNITLNSESDNFESELIQNQEQLDIEEILENTNDDPNTNE
jgi:preprotein translocase subunit SecG